MADRFEATEDRYIRLKDDRHYYLQAAHELWRSTDRGLQVSTCSGYDLGHSNCTHTHTAFDQLHTEP